MREELSRILGLPSKQLKNRTLLQVTVHCDGDAHRVLALCKQRLTIILSITKLKSFSLKKGRSKKSLLDALDSWLKQHDQEHNINDINRELFASDYIQWISKSRNWLWWDADVTNVDKITIYIELTGKHIYGFDALGSLLISSGAKRVEVDELVQSASLLPFWQRFKLYWRSSGRKVDEMEYALEYLRGQQTQDLVEDEDEEDEDSFPDNPLPVEWLNLLAKLDEKDNRIFNLSMERRSSAWTTGSCVVGKDMHRGLVNAMSVVHGYRYNHKKSPAENAELLAQKIMNAANDFLYSDEEGYATGTMGDIAKEARILGKLECR